MSKIPLENKINPQVVSLGSLLNAPNQLRVPVFQRAYSWEKDDMGNLLLDIDTAMEEREDYYYLGSMVMTPDGEDGLHLIDGQQRLASIS